MKKIKKYIVEQFQENKIDKESFSDFIEEIVLNQKNSQNEKIAIVGMGVKLPGGDNENSFWDNIEKGKDLIIPFPEERIKDLKSTNLSQNFEDKILNPIDAAYLENISSFDCRAYKLDASGQRQDSEELRQSIPSLLSSYTSSSIVYSSGSTQFGDTSDDMHTFTGNITASGNVTVGGTLTYEDVTNVDSVGLITAKSGVNVTGGQLTVGTAYSVGAAGVAGAPGALGAAGPSDHAYLADHII
ncbi:MAG: hypothetical protein HRT68_13570 [Flavobacteriaceae bacterium]|nr:hypothetical protein [Flavobacteriaceae bacterium]